MKKRLSNVYRKFTCYEGSTSKEVNFDIGDDKVILFLSAASLLACAENVGILDTEKITHTPPKVILNR